MVIQVQGIIARSSLALASLLQKHIGVEERSSAQYHRAEGEIFLDYFRKIIKIILHYTVKIDKLGDVAEGKALMRMGEL